MLFELLVLTGAQVGMDWTFILRKRHDFRATFAGFDAEIVVNFTERQIASVATDCNLDLNKVRSAVNNANRILQDKFFLDLSVLYISHAVDDMIKERFKEYRSDLHQRYKWCRSLEEAVLTALPHVTIDDWRILSLLSF
ncbi:uncharacterized protein LOC131238921 [Magnolia sinica]|uniref:uncharacterized protein LOC131238921 n=1 Tax=Magnolia sinica TaxID=86752 RepID=UPI002658B36B|nr:uncharacterized protein LOC131238921 [Magnolia sinica]